MNPTRETARQRLSRALRRDERRDEDGDTLIELLISMVIIAVTVASILSAYQAAIAASVTHRSLANMSTILRSYAEEFTFQVQFQPNPLYSSCASSYSPTGLSSIPSGYSVSISSITYWNGTAFASSCTAGSKAPQLITLSATGPYNQADSLAFVVATFGYNSPVLTVSAITSAPSLSVASGSPFSFTVTTSGSPPPSLTKTGTLPAGVTFVDNGDGTATLSGTGSVPTGTTSLTFTATNGVGPPATQNFTLTVTTPPQFTSKDFVIWTNSTKVSFLVTATGSPTPNFSISSGVPPPNVTLVDNLNGTATLGTGTVKLTSAVGNDVITLTANSGAVNTSQTFTFTVN